MYDMAFFNPLAIHFMTAFNDEDLSKLAKLCRIECTDEEKKKFSTGIKKILGYVEMLKEIDTEGVPSCSHVIETLNSVTREDTVGELLPRETFLANAPAHTGGMVRVPPVIQFE